MDIRVRDEDQRPEQQQLLSAPILVRILKHAHFQSPPPGCPKRLREGDSYTVPWSAAQFLQQQGVAELTSYLPAAPEHSEAPDPQVVAEARAAFEAAQKEVAAVQAEHDRVTARIEELKVARYSCPIDKLVENERERTTLEEVTHTLGQRLTSAREDADRAGVPYAYLRHQEVLASTYRRVEKLRPATRKFAAAAMPAARAVVDDYRALLAETRQCGHFIEADPTLSDPLAFLGALLAEELAKAYGLTEAGTKIEPQRPSILKRVLRAATRDQVGADAGTPTEEELDAAWGS